MIPVLPFSTEEKEAILHAAEKAKARLVASSSAFPFYGKPLLKVGDVYAGIWLEHNQDNVFLAEYDPEVAWNSQEMFMDFQREDGLLPVLMPLNPNPEFYNASRPVSYAQIQCVYSFTRCALEVAKKTGRPRSDLQRIYDAGARYDDFFVKKRNRANTGLVEMYCQYDTGHDNSPRVMDDGIPHKCPGDDAANMPDLPVMPVLSVDLSAMVYGGRMALAELADLLGRPEDAQAWRQKAQSLHDAIQQHLFDETDEFYYDRDTRGFRRYRTEHVTRLFLNKVLTQAEFDRVYDRYFTKPGREFLSAFPFPSISIDDPHFDKSCPKNSWGSNSQALTTERCLLWMEHYGRGEDLKGLLSHWLRSFVNNNFPSTQEINPFDGKPVGNGKGYCPSLIILIEGARRLFPANH